MLNLPPLSLYIHIPWCEKKCPYCDFNSHVAAAMPEALYVKKLKEDLRSQQDFVQGRRLHSIFIGGGTPSLFSAKSITAILDAASDLIGFEPGIEITMEANPSSSEREKFEALKSGGVNRLSIGVQSFDDSALKRLGRVHQADDAKAAILAAQKAGFARINVDLMHGLPHQTDEAAKHDLQLAVDFGVEHISWYQLTLEKNTAFYSNPPPIPHEDTLSLIQDNGLQWLTSQGFEQYEVSAFTKNNAQSLHNVNYWQFGDYLAIGAGAHGKVTLSDRRIYRFNNTRVPNDYLQKEQAFTAQKQLVDKESVLFEALLNGLRLKQGVSTELLLAYTDHHFDELITMLQPAIDKKLVTVTAKRLSTTDLGFRYLNTLLALICP